MQGDICAASLQTLHGVQQRCCQLASAHLPTSTLCTAVLLALKAMHGIGDAYLDTLANALLPPYNAVCLVSYIFKRF
jgi:hypothetical protein